MEGAVDAAPTKGVLEREGSAAALEQAQPQDDVEGKDGYGSEGELHGRSPSVLAVGLCAWARRVSNAGYPRRILTA